jgi:hypothetical protein
MRTLIPELFSDNYGDLVLQTFFHLLDLLKDIRAGIMHQSGCRRVRHTTSVSIEVLLVTATPSGLLAAAFSSASIDDILNEVSIYITDRAPGPDRAIVVHGPKVPPRGKCS